MSAREEILAAVRDALRDADPPPEVDRSYRVRAGRTERMELFVQRVEDYTAVVHRCGADEIAETVSAVVGGRSVVVPGDLPWDLGGAVADTGLGVRELDLIEVVVTAAALGIAETGTIVLDHGAGQGRRAISLVPDTHVCVLRESQVVDGVDDVFTVVDPLSPTTWISGPSATSDIELSRVEGVHGPRTLHVVLVAD